MTALRTPAEILTDLTLRIFDIEAGHENGHTTAAEALKACSDHAWKAGRELSEHQRAEASDGKRAKQVARDADWVVRLLRRELQDSAIAADINMAINSGTPRDPLLVGIMEKAISEDEQGRRTSKGNRIQDRAKRVIALLDG